MTETPIYHIAGYRSETEALRSVAGWQRAGWAVVTVQHHPELGERPWLLWLLPRHPDGAPIAAHPQAGTRTAAAAT